MREFRKQGHTYQREGERERERERELDWKGRVHPNIGKGGKEGGREGERLWLTCVGCGVPQVLLVCWHLVCVERWVGGQGGLGKQLQATEHREGAQVKRS